MTEDEKLVREKWRDTLLHNGLWVYEVNRAFSLQVGLAAFKGTVKDKDAVWKQAADFTRQRLREIEELEEEIATMENHRVLCAKLEAPIFTRILCRLSVLRDEKKQGMK